MRSKLDLPLLRPAAAVASAGRFAKALASLDAYTNAVSTTVVRPRALALLMPSRSSIGGLGCDARRSISIQQSRGLQPRLHLGGVSPTAAPGALPEATLASGELSKALRDGPHAALVSATHPAAKATSRIADSHATAVERGRVLNRDGGCWGRPWWRYGALSQLAIHKPGTWAELARVGDCATRQSRPVECCQALARREQHSRSGASRVGTKVQCIREWRSWRPSRLQCAFRRPRWMLRQLAQSAAAATRVLLDWTESCDEPSLMRIGPGGGPALWCKCFACHVRRLSTCSAKAKGGQVARLAARPSGAF